MSLDEKQTIAELAVLGRVSSQGYKPVWGKRVLIDIVFLYFISEKLCLQTFTKSFSARSEA